MYLDHPVELPFNHWAAPPPVWTELCDHVGRHLNEVGSDFCPPCHQRPRLPTAALLALHSAPCQEPLSVGGREHAGTLAQPLDAINRRSG